MPAAAWGISIRERIGKAGSQADDHHADERGRELPPNGIRCNGMLDTHRKTVESDAVKHSNI